MNTHPHGVGLGLRRELIDALLDAPVPEINFLELAPENWSGIGGQSARQLSAISERYPLVCHGLSLSLGGPGALDLAWLSEIRGFMDEYKIALYTEHLSWCADDAQLYELLPIPLSEKALNWTVDRIRRTQDILGQRIAIENPSYYLIPPDAEMSETAFISEVLKRADCWLHLDVNNVYVNSRNFGFDPLDFICQLPLERTCYIHVAGHYSEADGWLIDTHGSAVVDPVWRLLDAAYAAIGQIPPTCLERDFNIPSLSVLTAELRSIAQRQENAMATLTGAGA